MLFFASVEERRQSRFFAKKYSFWRVAEKRKIFFQKPEGLDLDGQAERANFACFFEFLNQQYFFSQISQITRIWTSTVLPQGI